MIAALERIAFAAVLIPIALFIVLAANPPSHSAPGRTVPSHQVLQLSSGSMGRRRRSAEYRS